VAGSGATWDAAGTKSTARVNRFKANAEDWAVPVADYQAVVADYGRGRGHQSNSGFHIFTRVSGCVVHNACVHFSVVQEQAILFFRYGIVSISRIPLNHDLKVSIVQPVL
jgi:hypothetical protein